MEENFMGDIESFIKNPQPSPTVADIKMAAEIEIRLSDVIKAMKNLVDSAELMRREQEKNNDTDPRAIYVQATLFSVGFASIVQQFSNLMETLNKQAQQYNQ